LGILSAELVTVYRSPLLGQAYHGALLILILLYAMFSAGTKKQKLLLALGLAPLIRLISLSTPQLDLNFPISYIIIGIILLIASLGVLRLAGFKREQVGLAPGKYLPVQLGIGLVGIGLGFLEYLIIRPEPLANRSSLPGILLAALVLFLFPGFIEELIFRGLMQRASTSIYKRAGPLYVSLIFTILHIGYRSWLDLIFVFLVALVFSVVVEQTRSLLGVTLAHGLANISLFLIFPYLLVAPLQNNPILPAPSVLVNSPAIWSAPGSLIPQSEVITVPTATGTATVSPASVIPSDTPVFSLTPSPTVAFTMTFTPSPTFTLTRTPSPWISPTATRSRTRTPTPTSRNTLTPTAIIITSTPTAIDTPSESPTPTPIPTDVLPIETP
jgi:membrane protease YdiL (CAAX protease family)